MKPGAISRTDRAKVFVSTMRKSALCFCSLFIALVSAPLSHSADKRYRTERAPATYLNSELPSIIPAGSVAGAMI